MVRPERVVPDEQRGIRGGNHQGFDDTVTGPALQVPRRRTTPTSTSPACTHRHLALGFPPEKKGAGAAISSISSRYLRKLVQGQLPTVISIATPPLCCALQYLGCRDMLSAVVKAKTTWFCSKTCPFPNIWANGQQRAGIAFDLGHNKGRRSTRKEIRRALRKSLLIIVGVGIGAIFER